MTTLADIVSSALSGADKNTKLASARDAGRSASASSDLGFLDAELQPTKLAGEDTPHEGDDEAKAKEKAKAEKEREGEKKSSARDVIADADFGMKLAQALDMGANILSQKLAADGTSQGAPGPQLHESGMQGAGVTVPKAQATVTDKITGPTVDGPPGTGLPTTKADFTSTEDRSGAPHNHPGKTAGAVDWTQDKVAATKILRTKVAQAEALMELGYDEQAGKLLKEIEAAQAKIAQDPSSPQPVMPGHSDAFKLDTEPGAASHIPDNAGLISMTKAQAKDPTVRETTQHFSETPKKDNAVPAHTLRTDGQKISHVLPARPTAKVASAAEPKAVETPKVEPKVAAAKFDPAVGRAVLAAAMKTAHDPNAAPALREKAASLLGKVKSKLGVDPSTLLVGE